MLSSDLSKPSSIDVMQGTPRELTAVIDAPNIEKASEALTRNKKFTS